MMSNAKASMCNLPYELIAVISDALIAKYRCRLLISCKEYYTRYYNVNKYIFNIHKHMVNVLQDINKMEYNIAICCNGVIVSKCKKPNGDIIYSDDYWITINDYELFDTHICSNTKLSKISNGSIVLYGSDNKKVNRMYEYLKYSYEKQNARYEL